MTSQYRKAQAEKKRIANFQFSAEQGIWYWFSNWQHYFANVPFGRARLVYQDGSFSPDYKPPAIWLAADFMTHCAKLPDNEIIAFFESPTVETTSAEVRIFKWKPLPKDCKPTWADDGRLEIKKTGVSSIELGYGRVERCNADALTVTAIPADAHGVLAQTGGKIRPRVDPGNHQSVSGYVEALGYTYNPVSDQYELPSSEVVAITAALISKYDTPTKMAEYLSLL